jgi:hypothetical protein
MYYTHKETSLSFEMKYWELMQLQQFVENMRGNNIPRMKLFHHK